MFNRGCDFWCKICNQSQTETIDRLISGCPILAKHDYLERHNKICKCLHWNICRAYGMDGLVEEWYNPVMTVGSCTVLYDQQIHTCWIVLAYKPDIMPKEKTQDSQRSGQDVGSKDRNYFNHRCSTGSHASSFIKRKFEKDSEEFKRKNRTRICVMWKGPHSSRAPSIFEHLFQKKRIK